MENQSNISDKVLKIKELISSKENEWTLQELQNYYNNINNSKDINENEKELLVEICARIINKRFPKRNSKKILGDKSIEGRELVEQVFSILKNEFDWSNNEVGTKVKCGGDMISGQSAVCFYISYKNKTTKINSAFHYRQKTVDSEPYLEVDFRELNSNTNQSKTFPVALRDEAITLYKSYLKKLIN